MGQLADAGYITRQRNGRRNQYSFNADAPLLDPIARDRNVGELVEVLTGGRPVAGLGVAAGADG